MPGLWELKRFETDYSLYRLVITKAIQEGNKIKMTYQYKDVWIMVKYDMPNIAYVYKHKRLESSKRLYYTPSEYILEVNDTKYVFKSREELNEKLKELGLPEFRGL